MARGMPSSLRQISAIAWEAEPSWSESANATSCSVARSMSRRTLGEDRSSSIPASGSGTASGYRRTTRSPAMCNGRWDVTSTVKSGFCGSMEAITGALSITCSKLSSTIMPRHSLSRVRMASTRSFPTSSSALAISDGTMAGLVTEASDTKIAPSGHVRSAMRATYDVRCVLPTPPVPVTVTTFTAGSEIRRMRMSISSSLPTNCEAY